MKVDDHPAPAHPAPTPGQFRQALQRAGASNAPARPPAASRLLPSAPRSPAPPPRSPVQLAVPPPRLPSDVLTRGHALATARSSLASHENLSLARQAMHHESLRLGTVRADTQAASHEKTEHRFLELVSQELMLHWRSEPHPGLSPQSAPSPRQAPGKAGPEEGVAEAVACRPSEGAGGPIPAEAPDPRPKVQATLQLIEKIELFAQSQRPALRMSLGWPLSAMVEVERTGPREVSLRIQGRHGPLAQEDLGRIREAMGARGLRLRSLEAQ